MAKKNTNKPAKKGEKEVNLSMTPLLIFGFILLVLNIALANFIDGFSDGFISKIIYLVAILAMVVYMFQIAFEKRTGKKELSEDEKPGGKKAKKGKCQRRRFCNTRNGNTRDPQSNGRNIRNCCQWWYFQ